jgi:hypothetical protein
MSVVVVEDLATVLCDAWFEICEEPTRWGSAPERKRSTFRAMARSAIESGRHGQRSVEALAEALCVGFWTGAEADGVAPWPWASLSNLKREVFRICARRLVAFAAERRRDRRSSL